MNKSMWGVLVIMLGVASIFFIVLFQTITNTDEHNSQLLKEVTEAAMWDAVDYSSYKTNGVARIDREKFIENFLRRFAESAHTGRTYQIDFMDINESPPKASIRVSSSVSGSPAAMLGDNQEFTFDIRNTIDAILETPY